MFGAPREIPVGSSLTCFDIPERNGLGLGYAVYVAAAPGTVEDFTADRGIRAFTHLTLGVDVEVTDCMGGVVMTTSDGTLSQLSKTVPLTGLSPGATYFVEVSSVSLLSNDSSIG